MLDSATHWIQQINIRENNCAIHWIEIYLVDRIIYLLNNWDQGSETSAVWNLSFYGESNGGIAECLLFFRLPRSLVL